MTNRTPFTHLGQQGRCGACRALLGAISKPIEIDSEKHFHAVVANSPVPVVVDFWAPWCAPCRTVAPEMDKVALGENGRILVVKVNTQSPVRNCRRLASNDSVPCNRYQTPFAF